MTRVFEDGEFRLRIKTKAKQLVWKTMRWLREDMTAPVEDRERTLPSKGAVNAIETEIREAYEARGETLVKRWLATKADPAGRDPRLAMMWQTSGSLYAVYVDREAAL